MCGIAEWIERLPDQYNHNVMERGATLSIGQRQLISFVRALVYDPRILILDEATSSIDTESEQLIQQAIEKLITGRTSIIIAHRLSTIQHANKILVLDKGEVKEMGSHEELLAIDGHYKNLYELQFRKRKPWCRASFLLPADFLVKECFSLCVAGIRAVKTEIKLRIGIIQ